MKKVYFLVCVTVTMLVSVANAQTRVESQNSEPVPSHDSKAYCELLGFQKFLSEKVTVQVDFGQNPYTNSKLVDENGKTITFNSMIDAMNYMGKLGWEFENAYVITHGSQNVYHWLLSKYLFNGENISDGFTTKRQFKDMQRTQEK